MMKLVTDESVDAAVTARLLADGHDVTDVSRVMPGSDDETVLRAADNASALLVTEDKDFGELVHRLDRAHHGVLLVRLDGEPSGVKADVVSTALRDHGGEMLGAFGVVTARALRIRRR